MNRWVLFHQRVRFKESARPTSISIRRVSFLHSWPCMSLLSRCWRIQNIPFSCAVGHIFRLYETPFRKENELIKSLKNAVAGASFNQTDRKLSYDKLMHWGPMRGNRHRWVQTYIMHDSDLCNHWSQWQDNAWTTRRFLRCQIHWVHVLYLSWGCSGLLKPVWITLFPRLLTNRPKVAADESPVCS